MKVKAIAVFVLALLALTTGFSQTALAEDRATPEEVLAKTQEAAIFLKSAGEAGLAAFNDPDSGWSWKDTYVFVYNCELGQIVAHPNSNLIGATLADLVDIKGNVIGLILCEASTAPKGSWAEYWWPKPGGTDPERKISYMLQVEGTVYQVGAGIYDDSMTIDELNALVQ